MYNNQLPYPVDRLIVNPPIQFGPGNPPIIPNISCPNHIQPYLAVIAATVSNIVSASVNKGSVRIFHYNQITANSYNNADYAQLVATAVDLIMYGLAKGLYSVVEDGIADACEKATSIQSSMTVYSFPVLRNYLTPQMLMDIDVFIRQSVGLQQEITMMKSGVQQSAFQQQQQPGWGGFPQQPTVMHNNPMMNRMPPTGVPMQSPMQMNSMISPNITGFGVVNQPVVQPNEILSIGDKYAYLNKAAPQEKLDPRTAVFNRNAHINARSSSVIDVPYNNKPSTTEQNWKPGPDCPYPIVSFQHQEGNSMDRSKHTIISSMIGLSTQVPQQAATRAQALNNSVDALLANKQSQITLETNELSDSIIQTISEEIQTSTSIEWLYEIFIDPAIFQTRVAHMLSNKGDTDCKVYQRFSIVGEPLVCSEEMSIAMREYFSNSTNFQQLCSRLKTAIEQNKNKDPIDARAYVMIDQRLTKALNRFLRNQLSLTKITIDSFIDDAVGLSDYLFNNFGAVYQQALLDYQEEFIESYLSFSCKEDSESLLDNQYIFPSKDQEDNNQGTYPGVCLIENRYSLTLVNVLDSELNLKINDDTANCILQSEAPVLYKLVKNIVDHKKNQDVSIGRHFLITVDDVRYELFKGAIGKDFYLIAKV